MVQNLGPRKMQAERIYRVHILIIAAITRGPVDIAYNIIRVYDLAILLLCCGMRVNNISRQAHARIRAGDE